MSSRRGQLTLSNDDMNAMLAAAETPRRRGRTQSRRPSGSSSSNGSSGSGSDSSSPASSSSSSSSAASSPKRAASPARSPVRRASASPKKKQSSPKRASSSPKKAAAAASPKKGSGGKKKAAASAVADPTNDPFLKYRAMVVRSVVGAVMLFVAVGMFKLNHLAVMCFVPLLQWGAFRELKAVLVASPEAEKSEALMAKSSRFLTPHFHKVLWFAWSCAMLGAYLPLLGARLPPTVALQPFLARWSPLLCFGLYMVCWVMFVLSLDRPTLRYQFEHMAWTIFVVFLTIFQGIGAAHMVWEGLIWIVVSHLCIVFNDISAYFCGFFLGKKIIKATLTDLSPSKSWEGFFGAWIVTTVLAWAFTTITITSEGLVCPQPQIDLTSAFHATECANIPEVAKPAPVAELLPPTAAALVTAFKNVPLSGITTDAETGVDYITPMHIHSVAFAAFASLVGPFAGFLMSGVKRAYGIKDFASIFPGHGGFVDRFDCQMVQAIFTYAYFRSVVNNSA